jgi:hypothetical protein
MPIFTQPRAKMGDYTRARAGAPNAPHPQEKPTCVYTRKAYSGKSRDPGGGGLIWLRLLGTDGSQTHRWRKQSGANSSLKAFPC